MTPHRFWSDAEKLDLVLDVLRANDLHQEACEKGQTDEANRQSGMYWYPKPCNCWLSEPDVPPALPLHELRIDMTIGGPVSEQGATRVTHLPTGMVASAATRAAALAEVAAKVAALRAAS